MQILVLEAENFVGVLIQLASPCDPHLHTRTPHKTTQSGLYHSRACTAGQSKHSTQYLGYSLAGFASILATLHLDGLSEGRRRYDTARQYRNKLQIGFINGPLALRLPSGTAFPVNQPRARLFARLEYGPHTVLGFMRVADFVADGIGRG